MEKNTKILFISIMVLIFIFNINSLNYATVRVPEIVSEIVITCNDLMQNETLKSSFIPDRSEKFLGYIARLYKLPNGISDERFNDAKLGYLNRLQIYKSPTYVFTTN